jgi:hypothetical protein
MPKLALVLFATLATERGQQTGLLRSGGAGAQPLASEVARGLARALGAMYVRIDSHSCVRCHRRPIDDAGCCVAYAVAEDTAVNPWPLAHRRPHLIVDTAGRSVADIVGIIQNLLLFNPER